MPSTLLLLSLATCLLHGSMAHPSHDVSAEAVERSDFVKRSPKSVRSCASTLQRRGHEASALKRRQAMAAHAQAKRGLAGQLLHKRDFAAYNYTHASTKDVTYGSDETDLFSDHSTCILQPEVTQGPYYTDGELIRSNIVEDQEGVPFYLDVQLIDTSTCEPVPAMFIDLWHCNATGVYSGVSANGNGDSTDTSNIDNTFLRGIVPTDSNGVAQFETIFPGHYTSRATHIHVLAHSVNSTTIRTNGTLLGSNFTTHASHVGQMFFDQDLITAVELNAPYNTNNQETTLNSDDMILSQEAAEMDPFVEYVYLGETAADGIMAWISIGIDPTVDDEVTSAGTSYEDGGVANTESSVGGGGGGGSAPNGTGSAMPSGTGAMPSSV